MRRVIVVFVLVVATVAVTVSLAVGVAYFQGGVNIGQTLELLGLVKPKPLLFVSPSVVAKSAGQYKYQNFAGVEVDKRDSSQALVAGTLISIDNQAMTALVELQIPDYVRSAAVKKYGVIEPKEQPRRIAVFLKPTTKFIDPFTGRNRTYEEMVSSQDGNLAKMLGLFIQIVATGRLDGKLEARQVAVAGITTVKK